MTGCWVSMLQYNTALLLCFFFVYPLGLLHFAFLALRLHCEAFSCHWIGEGVYGVTHVGLLGEPRRAFWMASGVARRVYLLVHQNI